MKANFFRKTHIIAQFKKCKYLLDRKFDFVKIHALGKAINQALCLALKIEEEMHNSISVNILTGTVEVFYFNRIWLVKRPKVVFVWFGVVG